MTHNAVALTEELPQSRAMIRALRSAPRLHRPRRQPGRSRTPAGRGRPPLRVRGDAPGRGDHGLVLDTHVIHGATHDLRLGDTLERTAKLLCGSGPGAWGTNGPALSAWDPARLTAPRRERAPQPTRTVFGGDSLTGTLRVSRVAEGVKESVSLVSGANTSLDAVPELLPELPDSFQTPTAHRVPGAADTHYRPVRGGAAAPVALALGPGPVSEIGLDRALAAPVTPERVGPRWSPTLWYPLGEGTSAELWQRFRSLMAHLDPKRA